MQTVLDELKTRWFLDAIGYRHPYLRIVLAEPISGEPESLTVGGNTVDGLTPLSIEDYSRRFDIEFEHVLAYHVIEESYTAWDEYETRDSLRDAIQVMTTSRFLDFLKSHHEWMFDIQAKAQHFRVWTYDAVIDVVAADIPTVAEHENDV